MRSARAAFLFIVLVTSSGMSQQFYQSGAFEYFNRGQYHTAVDSMIKWVELFQADRGIAYYYLGESYYNLGLMEDVSSRGVSFFKESSRYFDLAGKQTDLRSLHPEKLDMARYKWAWSHYRLAELEDDPFVSLERAWGGFLDVSSSNNDSLSVHALYMSGESRFWMAVWKRIQMHISDNMGEGTGIAREAIQYLRNAEAAFRRVADSQMGSNHLRLSARLRIQDVLIKRGKLYQRMSPEIFRSINDPGKLNTAEETSVRIFLQVDYGSVFDSMDQMSKHTFEPLITYSKAIQYLNLFLMTGEDQHRHRLNGILDSLRWSRFREDKLFFQACRDFHSDLEEEPFIRLNDPRMSFYAQAAQGFQEVWYWLGWSQFITNNDESADQFHRFLRESEGITHDLRLTVLREDAQYRLFFLRFDQNAANRNVLTGLRREIEDFRPRIPFIQEETRLLLQLIRIGSGESIWGNILESVTTEDRLRNAFILIRNMLVRATRVTGRERVPYLTYLDRLFLITEDRRPAATMFYRGLSMFHRAEIQETAQNKRQYYFSAADFLKSSEGDYRDEGMYVQARSYFAAAKHEADSDQRSRTYERAKPIFVRLINEARSLRSVYYLGEIFRNQRNDLAARRCYEIVVQKTRGQLGGAFWTNNAAAALQTCGSSGDGSQLNGIQIEDVVFPERLLVIEDVDVSLEKFADPEYVRRQYWEEAINLLLIFGNPKRTLYPSAFRLEDSRSKRKTFDFVTAGIRERVGAVSSGLQLRIVFPAGIDHEVAVTLNGTPLERDSQGFYQKASLPMSQPVEIRVESYPFYPFVETFRFVQPGLERKVVYLFRRSVFENRGTGGEQGVDIVHFTQRLDGNVVLHSAGSTIAPSTFLFKDFQSDVVYRDFIYSDILNGYLVVHSGMENLLLYRNDGMISQEGEFLLGFPNDEVKLKSPEGITIDSRGTIYIVDWGNHRVSVFQKDGLYLRSFGGFGINHPEDAGNPVRFVYPTRIAIAEDTEGIPVDGRRLYGSPQIYVADRNGIHLMDGNGIYWDSIVPSGMKKGSIYGLAARGFGSDVRLYVARRKTGEIERFVARPLEVE